MLKMDEIKRHLQDKRLSTVAEATGINHNYLIKLRSGKIEDPRYEYAEKLSDYFEAYHSYLSYEEVKNDREINKPVGKS